MAFGRTGALARFEFGQPGIGFSSGDVKAGGLVVVPGGEGVLAELLSLFFSLLLSGQEILILLSNLMRRSRHNPRDLRRSGSNPARFTRSLCAPSRPPEISRV